MKTSYKTSKTTKEYRTEYKGWSLVVPVGSQVDNGTAWGNDDSYRFWVDWREYAEKLTGYRNSTLAHDLTYYGLNIPAEFCNPYTNNS